MTHDNLEHDDWVRGGAFLPPSVANRHLATASDDGKIRVWNVDSQGPKSSKDGEPTVHEPLQVFEGHTDYAICVTFSPDGRYLASAGDDGVVCLWDRTATGPDLEGSSNTKPTARFDFRVSRIQSVTFSPDGMRIAASGYGGHFRIWDREGHLRLGRNYDRSFKSLRFSGDPNVDKIWIMTETGPVPIGDAESSTTLSPEERWPALASWSIDSQTDWIKYQGKGVIFLPLLYRPYSDAIFIQGSRVVIGCRSGLVLLLRFSENEELLQTHLGAP